MSPYCCIAASGMRSTSDFCSLMMVAVALMPIFMPSAFSRVMTAEKLATLLLVSAESETEVTSPLKLPPTASSSTVVTCPSCSDEMSSSSMPRLRRRLELLAITKAAPSLAGASVVSRLSCAALSPCAAPCSVNSAPACRFTSSTVPSQGA